MRAVKRSVLPSESFVLIEVTVAMKRRGIHRLGNKKRRPGWASFFFGIEFIALLPKLPF